MRRADHLTNAERALTLALVLVAAGYSPATISYRAVAAPDPAHREARRSDEARITATHENERRTNRAAPHTAVELPTRTLVTEPAEPRATGAPHATPYRSTFLAPPSQRGPPALG